MGWKPVGRLPLGQLAASLVGKRVYVTYPSGSGGPGLVTGWETDQSGRPWLYLDYGYSLPLMDTAKVEVMDEEGWCCSDAGAEEEAVGANGPDVNDPVEEAEESGLGRR